LNLLDDLEAPAGGVGPFFPTVDDAHPYLVEVH
jgi:hypothetical protein